MNKELANEKVYIVKRQILEGLYQLQVLPGRRGAEDDRQERAESLCLRFALTSLWKTH